jgi:mannose-6-phosphate isomerase-like protein (cupin superfamily)
MNFRLRLSVFITVAVLSLLPLAAQSVMSGAYNYWSVNQLKSYPKTLATKLNDKKLASESLGKYGNHSLQITLREASGEAEIHEKQSDVFVVQSGHATLVLGGEIVEGKPTTPGELRGTSIKGGERRELSGGDMVHISPNVPHQLLLKPGDQFTYVIVKIDAQ